MKHFLLNWILKFGVISIFLVYLTLPSFAQNSRQQKKYNSKQANKLLPGANLVKQGQNTNNKILGEITPLTIEAGPNQTVFYGYPPNECVVISWSGEGGGVPPYNISWSDGGSQTHQVCPGYTTTTYVVTITDQDGNVASDHVDICAVDVRCGKHLDKVEMCNVSSHNPSHIRQMCVGVNTVAHRMEQGSTLGGCYVYTACDYLKSAPIPAKDIYNETELNIYPNPTNGVFYIENAISGSRIRLFDMLGNCLIDKKTESDKESIDIEKLHSGFYFVEIAKDGETSTYKIVLNR